VRPRLNDDPFPAASEAPAPLFDSEARLQLSLAGFAYLLLIAGVILAC
jgi:hypothetical protein